MSKPSCQAAGAVVSPSRQAQRLLGVCVWWRWQVCLMRQGLLLHTLGSHVLYLVTRSFGQGNKHVLLYCFYNYALLHSSINNSVYHKKIKRNFFSLSQHKALSGEKLWTINDSWLNWQQQHWGRCKWGAPGCRMLRGDSWQSWQSFIPHKAVIAPEPLGQPHNKYRCCHTDSTSHRSRQFLLWVDRIWTPCPHLTPSNYAWQMLGTCIHTLILCSKESNFHIWH